MPRSESLMVTFSTMQTPTQLCSSTGVCPVVVASKTTSEILVEDAWLDLAKLSPLTSTEEIVKSSEFAISTSNDTSLPNILDAENFTPATEESPTDTSSRRISSTVTSPEPALIAVPIWVKLEFVTSRVPVDSIPAEALLISAAEIVRLPEFIIAS